MIKVSKKIIAGCIVIAIMGMGLLTINNNDVKDAPSERKEMLAMFIQDTEGKYQVGNSKTFPKEGYALNLEKSFCKNGGMLSQDSSTKKVMVSVTHNDQCTLFFDREVPSLKTFYDSVPKKTETPIFAFSAINDETANGLYGMIDDTNKMSYYFRGAVKNNYVKFGKYKDGKEIWWRIIRFNGDGSARIQYDGVSETGENTYNNIIGSDTTIRQTMWNGYDDNKYVGWMYGVSDGKTTSKDQAQRNETNSIIKNAVDKWYVTSIVETGYSEYVADEIFCNDRSIPGKDKTQWDFDTGNGYGTYPTAYGGLIRFMTVDYRTFNPRKDPQPQFKCPQDNDKFTVELASGGNGALEYPVGLITADEIVAAGSGKYKDSNKEYYLYKGNSYWSLTPLSLDSASRTCMFGEFLGLGYSYSGSNIQYFAPVINLKAEYLNKFEGKGTLEEPYALNIPRT